MKDINFLSNSKYIKLPTSNNPKVILAIDNYQISENSFKLYEPFSLKARILKRVIFIFLPFIKRFLSKKNGGEFIDIVQNMFNEEIISSIYFATDNNKVVIQIQNKKEILGYIKVPLNKDGEKFIDNEIKAFKLLKEHDIINYSFKAFEYNNQKCLFIQNIQGKSIFFEIDLNFEFLQKVKTDKRYLLSKHPRIKELLNSDEEWIGKIVLDIINKSSNSYKLVYEHGDFAPWNIKMDKEKFYIFDFEYFRKDGIEFFDFIKYYYQYMRLLKRKEIIEVYKFLNNKYGIEKEIFDLFVIKEYLNDKEEIELNYLKGLLR